MVEDSRSVVDTGLCREERPRKFSIRLRFIPGRRPETSLCPMPDNPGTWLWSMSATLRHGREALSPWNLLQFDGEDELAARTWTATTRRLCRCSFKCEHCKGNLGEETGRADEGIKPGVVIRRETSMASTNQYSQQDCLFPPCQFHSAFPAHSLSTRIFPLSASPSSSAAPSQPIPRGKKDHNSQKATNPRIRSAASNGRG